MGASKKYFYKQSQIDLSAICKAMGHPARISIIEYLAKYDHLCCNDLVELIPLSQSSISRHLNVLFETGILGNEVIGNQCYYRINAAVMEEYLNHMDKIQQQVNSKKLMYNSVYFKPSHASL
jgi:DNA-binding transcriptional ArsR family regulator